MLEIFAMMAVARKLGEMATERGNSRWWGALGVAFWLGGEVFGFILGALFGLEGLAAYPLALAIGALGVGVAWTVVKNLPRTTLAS